MREWKKGKKRHKGKKMDGLTAEKRGGIDWMNEERKGREKKKGGRLRGEERRIGEKKKEKRKKKE